MLGFCGAHRSGKTTLARVVAERMGLHFLETNVSGWMKEAGFDAVGTGGIEERIGAQEYLLDRLVGAYADAPSAFVTDRTPLDVIGYTLAEVSMHNTSAELGDRIEAYRQKALKATRENFICIASCRPLRLYAVEPGKPPMNRAYQWHVQTIIDGSMMQVNDALAIASLIEDDFEGRVAWVINFFGETMAALDEHRQHVGMH